MACLQILLFLTVLVFPTISAKGVSRWCQYDNKYLSTYSSGTHSYSTLASAKTSCLKREDCTGVTHEKGGSYTLRKDMVLNKNRPNQEILVPD